MRRLFFKIFAWFWVVQFVIAAVLFALTTALRFEPERGREHPEMAFALNQLARTSAATYENGGATSLRDVLRQAENEARIRGWLLDNRGREVSGLPVLPKAQDAWPAAQKMAREMANADAANQNNSTENPNENINENATRYDTKENATRENATRENANRSAPDFTPNESPNWAPELSQSARRNRPFLLRGPASARVVISPRGQKFVFVALVPPPPPRGFSPGFVADLIRPNGGAGALRLLVLTLVSGVLCWVLARYLTSPTVKLRRATQQLASGDLTTRVASQMGKRRDELADLGTDFDAMAERIEVLMFSERRLLADISHELRSPLARLTVALDLVEDIENEGEKSESSTRLQLEERAETRNYLARIRRESERLNALIGQLLTLSRLESGVARLENAPIDLPKLLGEIVQDADFEARSRDRRVEISHLETLSMNGAPELLRSAIENVVRNAVHYTRENTTVEVSLQKENAQVLIRVLDCGIGVPPDALENLFRPFYRVQDARDRQSGGTGLGLAISERAVRLHGGTIAAFNAPNGGLQVELRFPLGE